MERIGVLGAGAWGTALACVAARAGGEGRTVTSWAFEPEVAEAINAAHENTVFLPGIPLEKNITATNDMGDLKGTEAILLVPPAQHLGTLAKSLVAHLEEPVPLIICSKGIERGTLRLMSDVLAESAPDFPIAVLSGPSFAADVARGLPTAVTLACEDKALGMKLVEALGLPTFRPYYSDDIIGAEIGGALKNVIAIACGIVDGLKLGESARAALTTRGFAEIVRLGTSLGGRNETLQGLCGLGDLILTCSSRQSRNMSLGAALGEGNTMSEIMGARKSVTEGVHSADGAVTLAHKHQIEMPIATAVADIVAERLSINEAIDGLLSRPFNVEHR